MTDGAISRRDWKAMDALERLSSLFSPDQIAALKLAFLSPETAARSAQLPRQSHDLRVKPGRTDEFGRIIPTPLFIWSAEQPADYVNRTTEFPKLMWPAKPNAQGKQDDITVHDEAEQQRRLKQGYLLTPPQSVPLDPETQARQLFDSLSAEDQELLSAELSKEKRNRIAALLATMADSDVDKLLTKKARKTA